MSQFRIHKSANAFNRTARSIALAGEAAAAVDRYRRKYGGLWVGGSVDISADGISFVPNRLIRAIHTGLASITIPMDNVLSVKREFGWLTGIVVVKHRRGEFRFRCLGARGVARRINKHLEQRPNPSVERTASGTPEATAHVKR